MGSGDSKDPNIDMLLELDQLFYYGESKVSGTLSLNVRCNVQYDRLCIKLKRVEKVCWKHQGSNFKRQITVQNYNDQFILQNFDRIVNFDQYSYPFCFVLPNNIMDSFHKMSNLKIRYNILKSQLCQKTLHKLSKNILTPGDTVNIRVQIDSRYYSKQITSISEQLLQDDICFPSVGDEQNIVISKTKVLALYLNYDFKRQRNKTIKESEIQNIEINFLVPQISKESSQGYFSAVLFQYFIYCEQGLQLLKQNWFPYLLKSNKSFIQIIQEKLILTIETLLLHQ